MQDNFSHTILILSVTVALVISALLLRPEYFASAASLQLLIGGEVLLVAIANYRKLFFPVLFITFLCAGIQLPMNVAFLQARWIVLGVGAVAGVAVYMKGRAHSFGAVHLLALFCVLSAALSGATSIYSNEALLKAFSLFLLFSYAAVGARTSVASASSEGFFLTLLRGAEVITWFSALSYFVLRMKLFGNPNSLGAVMAVAVIPTLLWGLLAAERGARQLRLNVELVLAWALLLSSYSRAAIGAAVVSCFLVCIALRQNRLLLKGITGIVLLAICVVIVTPPQEIGAGASDNGDVAAVYVYKGKEDQGFWGSRLGPWQQTWKVIKEKPWFGSGFGTSQVTEDITRLHYAAHHFDTWIVREHGNSYLAILEWTGILGVIPFYVLGALTALNAGKVFLWVRRTRDVFSPALPAAAIVVAGLVDAAFEDWLFAVGYYVCVFFWVIAFILNDLVPREVVVYSPEASYDAEQYHAA